MERCPFSKTTRVDPQRRPPAGQRGGDRPRTNAASVPIARPPKPRRGELDLPAASMTFQWLDPNRTEPTPRRCASILHLMSRDREPRVFMRPQRSAAGNCELRERTMILTADRRRRRSQRRPIPDWRVAYAQRRDHGLLRCGDRPRPIAKRSGQTISNDRYVDFSGTTGASHRRGRRSTKPSALWPTGRLRRSTPSSRRRHPSPSGTSQPLPSSTPAERCVDARSTARTERPRPYRFRNRRRPARRPMGRPSVRRLCPLDQHRWVGSPTCPRPVEEVSRCGVGRRRSRLEPADAGPWSRSSWAATAGAVWPGSPCPNREATFRAPGHPRASSFSADPSHCRRSATGSIRRGRPGSPNLLAGRRRIGASDSYPSKWDDPRHRQTPKPNPRAVDALQRNDRSFADGCFNEASTGSHGIAWVGRRRRARASGLTPDRADRFATGARHVDGESVVSPSAPTCRGWSASLPAPIWAVPDSVIRRPRAYVLGPRRPRDPIAVRLWRRSAKHEVIANPEF